MADLVLDPFLTTYRTAAVAREILADNHRSVELQLAALRFYDLKQARPTNAGVLLFGANVTFFLPGAYVQYVRYDGASQSEPVSRERVLRADLVTNLRELVELARDVAAERPEPATSGTMDRIVAAFPVRAVVELLVNAAIHRNYESTTPVMVNEFSDRLEISSPGGLYGDLTPDQFPRVTAYRNPVLAEAAKVLGFVNRFGRGIDTAQAALAANGSRPAEFDLHPNHFLVRVWRRT